MYSHDAYEQLREIFEAHHSDWEKGLKFVEPQQSDVQPEQILARHHQILVNQDMVAARVCFCPPEWDNAIYTHERALERMDHFSRPDLPSHRRWG